MARIVVKCGPAPGFTGIWRAGRRWPKDGITVDTVTGPDDVEPTGENPVLQVGTKTMKALEDDGRFFFGIAGTIDEIEAIRAERDALKAGSGDVAGMKSALEEAGRLIPELRSDLSAARREIEQLSGQLKDTKAKLEAAEFRVAELEEAAGAAAPVATGAATADDGKGESKATTKGKK